MSRASCAGRHGYPRGRVSDKIVTSMDLYPTLAALCGGVLPDDRVIDGRDVQALFFGDGPSPHGAFFYYWMNDLEAVRSGRWKLHFSKRGAETHELYDLEADIGETTDVLTEHPDVVERLEALAEQARMTLGDARLGRQGSDVRPVGRVDDPRPLTEFDPDHPYFMAEYDLADRG